jgi:uncharacterized protein YndB with AHSA1/START domain
MTIHTRAINGHPFQQLSLRRLFDATPSLVFKAWTDSRMLCSWWGPYGFTNPVCHTDLRTGGSIRIEMKAPDGMIFPMHGIFHRIHAPSLLIFTSSAFEDEHGADQIESLNTVRFAPREGATLLSLQCLVVKASPEAYEALDGMEEGWRQSLDKLEGFLKHIA